MRLYKILNRYVDLDHVLSVTDPEVSCNSEATQDKIPPAPEPLLISNEKDTFETVTRQSNPLMFGVKQCFLVLFDLFFLLVNLKYFLLSIYLFSKVNGQPPQ